MQLRQIMANLLLSTSLITLVPTTLATDSINNIKTEEYLEYSIITNNENNNTVSSNNITSQMDELYTKIGNALNIEPKYVKILHILSGANAIYADAKPNIYSDETIKSMQAPFYIDGATTNYRLFSQVECSDKSIVRPSAYYMPDAAYSVTSDIVKIMNSRLAYDRGDTQSFFDSLKTNTKKNIVFCEALLLYIGEEESTVNNFYRAYEKIIYDKQKDENVLEIDSCGTVKFKDKYLDILIDNGIKSSNSLSYLAIILSFDEELAKNDNTEALRKEFVTPYIKNYTSRENLMIASMSLIGKARYVWGGGHSGTSNIDGINPVWLRFEQLYDDVPTLYNTNEEDGEIEEINSESFNHCIKPSGSWCPIHLSTQDGACSFTGPMIYSVDEYIEVMSKYDNTFEMDRDKYTELLKNVDFSNGISIDTLNGLDCSGYVSWLFNQITDKYQFNSVASEFSAHAGFREVEFGSKLKPGDVFAWSAHIVEIVGKVSDSGKVYITTEATPNIVKFGVVYYSGAKQSEIELAKTIANEANQLLGNTNEYELPHVYCMSTVGVVTEYIDEFGNIYSIEDIDTVDSIDNTNDANVPTDGIGIQTDNEVQNIANIDSMSNEIDTTKLTKIETNYCTIARLDQIFIDEDTIIEIYDKKIKDMTAQEIIQYTLRKIPYSYVTGYDTYSGEIFDKNQVAIDL